MEPDLDTRVRNLLDARRGDWPTVVAQVGVSHSWISKFVRGKIDNPGYGTLKRLHEHLTGRRTPVKEAA